MKYRKDTIEDIKTRLLNKALVLEDIDHQKHDLFLSEFENINEIGYFMGDYIVFHRLLSYHYNKYFLIKKHPDAINKSMYCFEKDDKYITVTIDRFKNECKYILDIMELNRKTL